MLPQDRGNYNIYLQFLSFILSLEIFSEVDFSPRYYGSYVLFILSTDFSGDYY